MLRRRTLLPVLPAWLAGCGSAPRPAAPVPPPALPTPPGAADQPPPPPREFRAAWVATVANIDWPSKPGLAAESQRSEALAVLDRARAIGLNALVLQVRPAADALYPSALEPWSECLSGEQGRPPWQAPEPPWDPLLFWVTQAHRRGIELHAWFNPYRARTAAARSPLAASHIALRQPALAKRYADLLWLDPGEPAAAAHMLAVVADVVRRYDIDGVHIDDYFYPYPVLLNGADQPFPDEDSWARYQLGGGMLARDDWRRSNVDALVQALQRTVREIKPWVRVGISPFGIGKPERRPPGITGFSQYDKLYADAERWLENGWLDYLAPQLYWPIAREGQPFPVLLDYWLGANPLQRHVWPGLFTSQVPKAWPARELLDQVAVQRSRSGLNAAMAPSTGHIHFSMVALMQDRDGIATLLQTGPYAQPALVPATPWLAAGVQLGAPVLRGRGGRVALQPGAGEGALRQWAVWRRRAGQWQFAVLPGQDRSLDVAGAELLVVSAVDRVGQLGEAATFKPG